MGADMCVEYVDMGDGSDECARELFASWRARVSRAVFNDDYDYQSSIEELHEQLMRDIETLEEGWLGNRRDAAVIDIPCSDGDFPHVVMLSGGMSWGEPPSDLYSAIRSLDLHNIFESTTSEKIVDDYKLENKKSEKFDIVS